MIKIPKPPKSGRLGELPGGWNQGNTRTVAAELTLEKSLGPSLKLTASSQLKMDGIETVDTILSFLGKLFCLFSGAL